MKRIKLEGFIGIGIMIAMFYYCSLSLASETASAMAAKIGVDVARTVFHSQKNTGRAVIIMDEIHNSRVAQLQEALILERLFYDYGVRQMVLEGYLTEDKKLDTIWFKKATGGDPIRRAKVAIQLLREGEINAGEYWKLVHPQVELIAAETRSEHAYQADGKAHASPEMLLLRIAAQSAEETLRRDPTKLAKFTQLSSRLDTVVKEFEAIKGKAKKTVLKQKAEEVKEAYNDYQVFLIKLDPWCGRMWEDFKKIEVTSENPSLEKTVQIAMAIKTKADDIGLNLTTEEKKAISDYIAFMQARHEGTLKIAKMLKVLCGRKGPPVVAIIGIGHSVDLVNELKLSDCSYAFLRPLIVDENRENAVDIPFEMYERKYKRLSIYSEGALSQALETLNTSYPMKPSVVLSEPWLIGKAESYSFIDRITEGIFGKGPPNQPPILPPSWNDGSFRGEFVFIDPKRIQLIADDHEVLVITDDTLKKMKQKGVPTSALTKLEKLKDRQFLQKMHLLRQVEILLGTKAMKEIQEPLLQNVERINHTAVLIPIVFNRGTSKETTIWAKATQGQAQVSSEERQAIESMLKDALKATKENKALSKSAVDIFGRVQIGLGTVVAFGKTSDVRKTSLTTR